MTPPTSAAGQHNTFAIPRHYRRHGETDVKIRWVRDFPLVPWSVHGHEALFALVDNVGEQLDRFRLDGPQPDDLTDANATAGHLVVISGAKGAGKTSLIHYCVKDLVARLDAAAGSPVATPTTLWARVPLPENVKVVELAGKENIDDTLQYKNGHFAGIVDINRNIYTRILEILAQDADDRFRRACESPGRMDLHSANLEVCYPALSRLLGELHWTILVIVPNIKWNDPDLSREFLRACSSYCRPGIVFFVESTNSSMSELMGKEFSDTEMRRVTHLTIGRLDEHDCRTFIEQRLLAAGEHENHIGVAEDAHNGYDPTGDYGCVRTMQLTFYDVAEEARRNGVGVIDKARLRAYQESLRPRPDSFTREPRAGRQGSAR